MKTLWGAGLVVMGLSLSGCGAAGMQVKGLEPSPDVFTKLEEGAKKLGWKYARDVKTGVEFTAYPPGQEFDAFTQDGNLPSGGWGHIAVRFRCKPGPKDECKKVWNALSTAGGVGVLVE